MDESREPVPEGRAYPGETRDEINLLEYWRVVVERRGVVLGCLAATVLAVLLVTFLTTPQYRAETTLQIERQGPDILTFKDVMGVDPMGYRDFYQTQYKILQSRAVLRLAAERLDLPNQPEFASRKGSPIGRLVSWIKSAVIGSDATTKPMERAVGFLESGVGVDPVRNSHLVTVSFVDRDPEFAAEIANAVADAYQQFNIENRYTTTEQATEFLSKEVARQKAEIEKLERELQQYTADKKILALSDGTSDIHEQSLTDLNTKLAAAKGRLAIAKARFDAVSGASPESLPEVLDSNLISRLRENYAELDRRHSQMAERFKPGWPEMAQLEEEMRQARERIALETDGIARQVREAARTDYLQAESEVVNLKDKVDQERDIVQKVKLDTIQYESLKNEIATRRQNLAELVSRQSQTETSGQLREAGASNIRVVDRAVPPEHAAKPRKALNLALSLLLGLLLGVGMAFLLHYLDNTIKSEQDIARYAPGAAILGHIPLYQPLRVVEGDAALPAKPDLASHAEPRSVFAESFKNLRTSLLLASADHPPRHIVVTSCEPGDGKSTIAVNLATVLTQMGKRVVLVDADLRRPRIHRGLALRNGVGLSSYLSGNVAVDDLFQSTDIPHLSVVTSGPIPPNPSELVESPRLLELLAEVAARGFDHVVFDSPPTIQVADSVILGTKTDATLVVVRAGMTRREALTQGVDRLRQSRVRLAGTVLNAVTERTGYYYRYQHSRKYAYGHEAEDVPGVPAEEAPRASTFVTTVRRIGRRANRA